MEPENVVQHVAEDEDVTTVLATTSEPVERKFAEMLCHWLILFWTPTPDRELYEYDVESVISEWAADALQLQVLDSSDDL